MNDFLVYRYSSTTSKTEKKGNQQKFQKGEVSVKYFDIFAQCASRRSNLLEFAKDLICQKSVMLANCHNLNCVTNSIYQLY